MSGVTSPPGGCRTFIFPVIDFPRSSSQTDAPSLCRRAVDPTLRTAQNRSEPLRTAQNRSEPPRTAQNRSARRFRDSVFALLLGPFTFFNAQKTKYLQILTSLMRWIGEDEATC
ncbi:Transmembrane protein 104 [Liparis tanakae]|uniref:Transmembrane protein 104 n=1 Tax=Liparis tanakae TaxID=230148 RepID=A0A4Z2EG46_9TELE|nr:Transmembrane protein 104 [Liparis tanakae]